jgi:hypothetical protein
VKLINIEPKEDGAVTLQLEREEFHSLQDGLREGLASLSEQDRKCQWLLSNMADASEDELLAAIERLELAVDPTLVDVKDYARIVKELLARVKAVAGALEAIIGEHDLARYL